MTDSYRCPGTRGVVRSPHSSPGARLVTAVAIALFLSATLYPAPAAMSSSVVLAGGQVHVHISCSDCSSTAWTHQQIATLAELVAQRLASVPGRSATPLPLKAELPGPSVRETPSLGKNGPRTRTGCFTCRGKRVKCDEAKVRRESQQLLTASRYARAASATPSDNACTRKRVRVQRRGASRRDHRRHCPRLRSRSGDLRARGLSARAHRRQCRCRGRI